MDTFKMKMLDGKILIKSILYRVFATGVAILTASAITRSWKLGTAIGLIDAVVKIFTYYIYEKLWITVVEKKDAI